MDIINELLLRLRDLLELCHKKNRELDAAKQALATERETFDKDQKELDAKWADFDSREARVANIEVNLAYRQESDRLRKEAEELQERTKRDRQEFETFRSQEQLKFNNQKTSLDQGWKDLNARSAKLESELNARVEEFLKKLKK